MKKLISFLIVFLLVLTTAFADTVNDPNLQPVPDSSIQSSNWTQYIPAEGEGVSGASIMQDNSSDNTLTRKWVYEGGYTSVSETIPVASTVWVQSSQYVPPVTQQQEIVLNKYAVATFGAYFPGYGGTVTNQWILTSFNNYMITIADYDPSKSRMGWLYETYGIISVGYDLYGTYPYNSIVFPSGTPVYQNSLDQQIIIANYNIPTLLQIPGVIAPMTYESYNNLSLQNAVLVVGNNPIGSPGFVGSTLLIPVQVHTGQYQTVVVQPGYYEDTSHWETTVTYETKQDMVYSASPHWTEYESIIPQYQLKN
ncbi:MULTISPECIES: hypothetical protein [Thermoanaerobacterium]|uniref:Uncharacterized protein n=2 Tax=Thermoanaerobacterium TaxID=28895 RepID=W9E9U4_9THEO|nr:MULTISPECIES: hypothetical protein [Thermoanaerobacterium]AFK85902.1 hypothetical protein Tsac_0886 [Thermoanaerobacterium saccharolyticum JW/SL-YS485]ETO38758.1 hypothetical protein V518_1180 [Thermoanaerobacterium aotearoense SCUT27]